MLPTLTVEECIRYSAILRCAGGCAGSQNKGEISIPGGPGGEKAVLRGCAWLCSGQVHPVGLGPTLDKRWPSAPFYRQPPAQCRLYPRPCRLPHASAAEVQAAVQSVVAELGLQHVARSRVGGRSGIRGISGGERRRWATTCVAGCAVGCVSATWCPQKCCWACLGCRAVPGDGEARGGVLHAPIFTPSTVACPAPPARFPSAE